MIELRDMQLLTALARHKHFARAAADCGISQPAFSARIRKMEQLLGTQIVQRGNRFVGFTPDGVTTLSWSQRILRDADAMRQNLQTARGELSGTLSIGVVPTALSFSAQIPMILHKSHPKLVLRLISATSDAILRGLDDHSFDAGVTYTDVDMPQSLEVQPLYEEHYILLCPPTIAPRKSGTVTWAEAAALPLCLLTGDMHNRRSLDAIFAKAGHRPKPVMETNAFTSALGQIASGMAATIVPAHMASSIPSGTAAIALELNEPQASKPIGLVTSAFNPPLPAITSLKAAFDKALR